MLLERALKQFPPTSLIQFLAPFTRVLRVVAEQAITIIATRNVRREATTWLWYLVNSEFDNLPSYP